jgi:ankyrin repeat protein
MRAIGPLLLLIALLGAGPAPAAETRDPNEPELLYAADTGDIGKVKSLLDSGIDVNTHGLKRLSALNWAAYSGHLDIVQLLLERGASIDSFDNDPGWSALMNASATGHVEVAEYLLSKGARIDLQSNDKWTAIDFAAAHAQPEVVRMLLAHGADGAASLLSMVRKNDAAGVGLLLNAGVNANARGADGETALYRAMAVNEPEVATVLLAHDADPNLYPAEESNMDTPLKWAAYNCDWVMASALIGHGANKSGHGDDAYDLARTGWTHDMKPCASNLQELLRP